MACVAVNSLVRTIELEFLQPLPRPIVRQKKLIPGNEELIQNLHQKLGDLIEVLDESRMDGIQAIKDLETKLRDVAFRVEDEIEFQIVDLYEKEEKEELLAGIAGLFVEKPQRTIDAEEEEEDLGIAADLCVEKAGGGEPTDAQRSWHSFKLGCVLEEAIRDIDAIHNELSKLKMELESWRGKKTSTLAAASTRCSDRGVDVMMMAGDSSHPLQGSSIMVGKNNEFHIVKEMLIQHSSRQREIVSITGMGGIGKTTLARCIYEDPSIASHFDQQAWVVASQYHDKVQMLIDLLKSMGVYVNSGTQDQLAQRLYQNLMHERYFVVIDDIWSVEAWDSINACFPDNGNGSRVLLTTRFAEVATSIGSNNDFSHQVQFLDQTESWNLFRGKASKSRYAEFEAIGRPIVKKCKGFPLAIVVAAGLFSKLHSLDEWKNVAETLNSSATTTIDEECSRILSSSYNHLPHSLKACFLYLSIFPGDKEIYVKKIVKLWVAEGLVKTFEDMSFDAVARRYIQELKDRNLILVNEPSTCGRKVKTFRVHEILHSFCVREAKKENLLHVVYENGYKSPPNNIRWVSIQSGMFNRHTSYSFLKNCRSIFVFSAQLIPSILKFCSLVRVIHKNVKCEFAYLVHLRCVLSWLGFFPILDPFHSWNLQTLSIIPLDSMSFLEFPQLEHFGIYSSYSDFPIFFHQNLKSLIGLIPDQCTKELFTNIPYLRKLEIQCDGSWSGIDNLAYSHHLQSLHLLGTFSRRFVIPNINRLVCLKNLMKLKLRILTFEWKAISILSKLPKLEVLWLNRCKCIGEEWELLEEENFEQLIYLEIAFIDDLKRWEASASHFPNLERLVLYECGELEKIPAEFAEIPNLKLIELNECCGPVVDSAKEIQKEQHEQGNYNMVVIEKGLPKFERTLHLLAKKLQSQQPLSPSELQVSTLFC